EHLVFDWGEQDGTHVFCAVLAWSRWRFVRFAQGQDQATTLGLLAECLELLGGVPGTLLTDRMGCLKGGIVAGLMVPAPGYVAFAAHYGFAPDFCEAGDPESKGIVEYLVGYAKSDLLIGLGPFDDLAEANVAATTWCGDVNGRVHSETMAVPDERLAVERTLLRQLPGLRPTIGPVETRTVDKLRTVRFGSARYSVPGPFIGMKVGVTVEGPELVIRQRDAEIARHRLVGPGELSLTDDHYGGPARRPARALRPRTPAELAFLSLGPAAEAFLRAAAGAGMTKLPTELASIVELERAHGREALVAALERALAHRRFRAADIGSILAAGPGVSRPRAAGSDLAGLPAVPERPLAAYAIEGGR
ncbi:MAG: IS21 family transposase, partial [Chloroflexota bacterium]|nr:IS21 family transposase [Chloroflexota bacterium]